MRGTCKLDLLRGIWCKASCACFSGTKVLVGANVPKKKPLTGHTTIQRQLSPQARGTTSPQGDYCFGCARAEGKKQALASSKSTAVKPAARVTKPSSGCRKALHGIVRITCLHGISRRVQALLSRQGPDTAARQGTSEFGVIEHTTHLFSGSRESEVQEQVVNI